MRLMENFDNKELKSIEVEDDAKKELIERLVALQDVVKFRNVDAMGVTYANERGVPILNFSNEGIDEDGYVHWAFHFFDDDVVLTYIEPTVQETED